MDPTSESSPESERPDSDAPTAVSASGSGAGLSPEEMEFVFEEDHSDRARYKRLERRLLFSTFFSGAVVLFALGMMYSMLDDVRYWFQDDSAPQALEMVDVLDQGGSLAPWQDQYVALSGTPDALTAVKVSLGNEDKVTQKLRFFRLLEAGNRVFVQTDLQLDADSDSDFALGGVQTKKLPGRFVGRVHRLGEVSFYSSLRDHYNALARPEIFKLDRASWPELSGKNLGLELSAQSTRDIKAPARRLQLADSDKFEVLVLPSELEVQLGTKTWPSEASAIERVKSLGLPFVHLPYKALPLAGSKNPERVVQGVNKQQMHRFVLRPQGRSAKEIKAALQEGLEIPVDNARLEVGAGVHGRRHLYTVAIDKLQVQGEQLHFDPQSKVVSPGYELVDGQLQERSWGAQGLSIPLQEVAELRVRRPVMATENSMIVLTDSPPSKQWPTALAFGILAVFSVANVFMGLRFYRRYAQLRSAQSTELDLETSPKQEH